MSDISIRIGYHNAVVDAVGDELIHIQLLTETLFFGVSVLLLFRYLLFAFFHGSPLYQIGYM
jgi:hypothetical protein